MLVTELYKGQGFGNQLWCYIVTRIIAKDHGYDFGIQSPQNFKGAGFFNIDMGKMVVGGSGPEGGPPFTLPNGISHYYREKELYHWLNGSDIRIHDDALINVPDNTKIEGVMQDENYIIHRKEEIRDWLALDEKYDFRDYASNDICVINFRGGEYANHSELFLTQKYWNDAMDNMRKLNANFKFVVITDDVKTAKNFFPNLDVFHFDITKDYSIIKNAHYLILSNSSFAWFPAWLNENLKFCIAPKYWARHNISDGYWSSSYNITSGWMYQDTNGKLYDHVECKKELEEYINKHKEYFIVNKDVNPYSFSPTSRTLYLIQKVNFLVGKIKIRILPFVYSFSEKVFLKLKNTILLVRHNILSKEIENNFTQSEIIEIAEYRKNIKIYDCFIFFNELDLLELRLNILNDSVDKFVLIEATKTFTGISKPLYYKDNKDMFKQFNDKIIHVIVDDMPDSFDELRQRYVLANTVDMKIINDCLTSDNVPTGAVHWLREFYQKEQIKKGLLSLDDSDICYISDVDEIWNPKLQIDYRKDTVFKLKQYVYSYFLNNRSDEKWYGTFVTKYKNIKNASVGHLDTPTKTNYTYLRDGGWHFTFQGGADKIKSKIAAYGHQEFNTKEIQEGIEKKMAENKDFVGRKFKFWIDEANLPKYILNNKKKYEKFFKQF